MRTKAEKGAAPARAAEGGRFMLTLKKNLLISLVLTAATVLIGISSVIAAESRRGVTR